MGCLKMQPILWVNHPFALQNVIDAEVQNMLAQGIIQSSFSPWASPIVMVMKKDGLWQFCVDYHQINSNPL